MFSEYDDPWWPANATARSDMANTTVTFSTSPASPAIPALSPALEQLEADGWEVVVPAVPGFDGAPGFVAARRLPRLAHGVLGRDRRHRRRCRARCVGASVGGMIAAELAALRPEAVTGARAARAVRHRRRRQPRLRPLRRARRPSGMAHLFAKGVPEPFADRFAHLGPEEGPVASYLERRRRRQPAVAARRPWAGASGSTASRCPTLVALGRPGRAAARRADVAAWADGRRHGRGRSPAPAICSSGTRRTRSPPASSSSCARSRRRPPSVHDPHWGCP